MIVLTFRILGVKFAYHMSNTVSSVLFVILFVVLFRAHVFDETVLIIFAKTATAYVPISRD